jgi:hypothetical protein
MSNFSQESSLFLPILFICCVLVFVFLGIFYIVAVQNGDFTKLSEKNVKILFLLSAVIFIVYVTNFVPIDTVQCFIENSNTEKISEISEPENTEKLEKAAVNKKTNVVPWTDVVLYYAVWVAALFYVWKHNSYK